MRTRRLGFRLSGLILAIGACALAGGCAPDVKEIRAEGIAQYRNRQHVESMATLRHVLNLSPNDATANYYMGMNYRAMAQRKFNQGDVTAARRELDTAIVYFTQAIKSWPNYMAAVQAKNEALELRGKYDEALTLAERVARNNRGIAEHYVFLADEYRVHGDYDNALRAYRQALASDPNSASAYEGLAKLYEATGDYAGRSEALAKLEQLRGEFSSPGGHSASMASPRPTPAPTAPVPASK